MTAEKDPRIEAVTHIANDQVWRHVRRPLLARIVRFHGGRVQVADDSDNTLRWLTIDGLMRDYRLEGKR